MNAALEVSVIMANRNGGPHLGAAIQSLREQTLSSWELVFVDDASTDDSARQAERLAAGDPRIRVVRLGSSGGPARARNCALELVRGRWTAVFDSDDLMLPDRLATLHARAIADGAKILADNQLQFSGSMRSRPLLPPVWVQHPRWVGLVEFVDSSRLYSRIPDLGYLKPFIETATLQRLGVRYDERLRIGEDYDFMARLLSRGLSIRLEPRALYLYRKHANSTSYRLRRSDIAALIEANESFVSSLCIPTRGMVRALGRRKRSLETMLLYDDFVAAVKARQFSRAAGRVVAAPRIWPLMAEPVAARLRRLRARTRSPQPELFKPAPGVSRFPEGLSQLNQPS